MASIASERGRTMMKDIFPLQRMASTAANGGVSPLVAPLGNSSIASGHSSVVCATSQPIETLG